MRTDSPKANVKASCKAAIIGRRNFKKNKATIIEISQISIRQSSDPCVTNELF